MKHKAKITISRPSSYDGEETIKITIKDVDAASEVITLELSYEAFTQAITGLSLVSCDMTLGDLEVVGRVREQSSLIFEIPEGARSSKGKSDIIKAAALATPNGWTPPTYFGSQNSFFKKGGVEYATGLMLRWVEKEGSTDGDKNCDN